jgi:hypothetical protein
MAIVGCPAFALKQGVPQPDACESVPNCLHDSPNAPRRIQPVAPSCAIRGGLMWLRVATFGANGGLAFYDPLFRFIPNLPWQCEE